MVIGYLYVSRNRTNNVAYVGQSGRLDPQSVQSYLGSGDLMRRAIEVYGADSFSKEVLGYFNDQNELDHAEILKIAELRDAGTALYNGGVGGPRAEAQFIGAMRITFGVVPSMTREWLDVVSKRPFEVKSLLAGIAEPSGDDFYRELEAQLLVTQDLGGECPGCGATRGDVCRTKTGNPSRNHARRPRS